MRIWKYTVQQQGSFAHEIPRGAQFLHLETQRCYPKMWFLVDPQQKKETRLFVTHVTGVEFHRAENEQYCGTFIDESGYYVGHVFMEKK